MAFVIHTLPPLPNIRDAKAERRKTPKRGYSVEAQSHRAPLLSDDQVVQARGMHRYQGVSAARLAQQFGTNRHYMDRVLRGETRSKVRDPRPEDFGRSA